MHWQGSTTLVTGASSGIGEAFARELGRRGSHLILAARSGEVLERIASEIRAASGVEVRTIALDLAQDGAADTLYEQSTAEGPVDAVINNAGFGYHGQLATAPPERVSGQVMVNITALTELTRAALPSMLARGRGAVLNIASTAGFQPIPLMAVYAASKAYVISFTSALAAEVTGSGVDVLAVCPGSIDTNFYTVTGGSETMFGSLGTAEQVVAVALRSLGRRRVVKVGIANSARASLARTVPLRISTWGAHRMSRRGLEP
jgi:short-subunit dehydrogenase